MWKSVVGHDVSSVEAGSQGDDWETDPDFENDVSEQEQRWGAKTIEGSGRKEHISVAELRQKVSHEHEVVKKKELQQGPKASYGYGGKFGVETDRMDKGAVGHSYVAEVEQHSSQTDAAQGFGGKFGVQNDRLDKSAVGFDYKADVKAHASQKDYSKGFGGKYGVEKEKVDKAALGYDYKGQTEKHQSQKGEKFTCFSAKSLFSSSKHNKDKKMHGLYMYRHDKEDLCLFSIQKLNTYRFKPSSDYSKGFGGKYGVEKEKVDKAALGYDYVGQTEKHQSQKDYAKGFGGRYGVEADRMDKSAATFSDIESPASAYEKTKPVEASSAGAGNLKARFENMARSSDEENRKRAEEERARRQAREKREQEEARRRQESQEGKEEQPLPIPEPRIPPKIPRPLPETPHDEPEPMAQVYEQEVEYEEPPGLPPRSDDLLEQLEPGLEKEDDNEYEDIGCNPVIDNDDAAADYVDMSCGSTAVALYDYQGEADDEISFSPDDVITDIEMVDEGWWKGTCHGRTGLFPATFVQLKQ
ncbi:src substrate protein p85-like isoform X1 [Denticeps clupeoides]|uniref:src substrate protein p85-like isoform X1 n=1 Tax=Denticeps clupeoides TaxID=299321 RepID=UPI0010A4BF17|nr:src substrate cortactin-like isoform X1 [Denticeps clupeoides]